jgi:multisubunit Na+/H+ antiporter MnhF subunit
MNAWLCLSAVLLAAVVPLVAVAARRPPEDGLVALEAAGVDVTLALLLFAKGAGRDALSDMALVLAAAGVAGSLIFAALLEREP